MKSNIFLIVLFLFNCYHAFAQPKGAMDNLNGQYSRIATSERASFKPVVTKNTNTNISNFLNFYIPSSITSEGIEPAAVSNLNVDFGDDKVKLKWGYSGKKNEEKFLKTSFGIVASAKAPEGVRTLFKYDKTPTDIQLGLAFTQVINEKFYSYNGIQSSEEAYWLNVNIDYTRNKFFLFSNDTAYNEITNHNFSLLVSFNHYYNTWFKKEKIMLRNIWNVGVGVGHFSNYDELDDLNLRKGTFTGTSFSEKESVVGKSGAYSRDFGILARGSFFYPVSHPESKAYVMLGVNLNTFGIGSKKFTANTNGGIYVSKRKYDEDEKLLTDVFSFGILADYSALENWGTKDYAKDNFKIIFVSQIPLRWK